MLDSVSIYFRYLTWDRVGFEIGILIGVMMLEVGVLGWKKCSLYSLWKFQPSERLDIYLHTLILLGFWPVLKNISSLGVVDRVTPWLKSLTPLNLLSHVDSGFFRFAISFVLMDFLLFVYHWASHRYAPLWELHKCHHSATHLNLITTNRVHPLESAFKTLFYAIPFSIVGTSHVESVALVTIFWRVTGFLNHSHLPWSWGWFGRYIWVSPRYHLVHHSLDPEHYSCNFGTRLILWDTIFKTRYSGAKEVKVIGIHDNYYMHMAGPLALLKGQVEFLKSLVPKRLGAILRKFK